MKSDIKKKLLSYGALSSAFIAGGIHEAEAQIVYVDIPDEVINVSATLPNSTNTGTVTSSSYTGSYNSGFLDIIGGQFVTSGQPYDVRFNAYAWVTRGGSYSGYTYTGTYSYTSSYYGTYTSTTRMSVNWASLNFEANNSSDFLGTASSGYIRKVNAGEMIGPGGMFANEDDIADMWMRTGSSGYYSYTRALAANFYYDGDPNWNFTSNGIDDEGFLGFKFMDGPNTHYGWVRVRMNGAMNVPDRGTGGDITSMGSITILDYAYQQSPDTAIPAGAMSSAPIPTMGQWGLIILNFLLLIVGITAVKERGKLKLKKVKA